MNPIDELKSVLCDPEGKCSIAGSDEDRAIIDRALKALAEPVVEPVGYASIEGLRQLQSCNGMSVWCESPSMWGPKEQAPPAPPNLIAIYASPPPAEVPLPRQITEEMHQAACKVLTRANGLDGTPQRMLDAMRATSHTRSCPTRWSSLFAAWKLHTESREARNDHQDHLRQGCCR